MTSTLKIGNPEDLGWHWLNEDKSWKFEPHKAGKRLWVPGDPVPELPFGQHERIGEALDNLYIPEGCGINWTEIIRFLLLSGTYLRWPDGNSDRIYQMVTFDDWQFNHLIPKYGLYYDPLVAGDWDDDYLGDDVISKMRLKKIKRGGVRVIRRVDLVVGRGAGKTTLFAVEGVTALLDKYRPKADWGLYGGSGAQVKKTIWPKVKAMAEMALDHNEIPDNLFAIRQSVGEVENLVDKSKITVGAGGAVANVGMHHDEACIDEYFAQRGPELIGAIKTGFGKRDNTCLSTMTTPSPDETIRSFAKEDMEEAEVIQKNPGKDPSRLVRFYIADKTRPWDEVDNILLANPHMKHGVLDAETISNEIRDAQNNPRDLVNFKWSRLCWWNDTIQGSLMTTEQWKSCAGEMPDDFLHGVGRRDWQCVIGADFSLTRDLTSICCLFYRPGRRKVYVTFVTWATDIGYRRLRQWSSGDIDQWIDSGRTTLKRVEGNRIPIDEVHAVLVEMCRRYDVRRVGIDFNNPHHTVDLLGAEFPHLDVLQLGQGSHLTGAIKLFEAYSVDGKLVHNGDPVVQTCVESMRVTTTSTGGMSIDRARKTSNSLIDCAIAVVMAFDRLKSVQSGKEPKKKRKTETSSTGLFYIDEARSNSKKVS